MPYTLTQTSPKGTDRHRPENTFPYTHTHTTAYTEYKETPHTLVAHTNSNNRQTLPCQHTRHSPNAEQGHKHESHTYAFYTTHIHTQKNKCMKMAHTLHIKTHTHSEHRFPRARPRLLTYKARQTHTKPAHRHTIHTHTQTLPPHIDAHNHPHLYPSSAPLTPTLTCRTLAQRCTPGPLPSNYNI